MYLEFTLLIVDYFKSLKRNTIIFDWVLPGVIGLATYSAIKYGADVTYTKEFTNSSINLLGILLGFSITIITIITTSNGENIAEIKSHETDIKINDKKISLYKLLLIHFTYTVVAEAFLILFCLIHPILTKNFVFNTNIKIIGFSILVCVVSHVFLLTIRNLTHFYFIITKEK